MMGTAAWLVSRERYHRQTDRRPRRLHRSTAAQRRLGAAVFRGAQPRFGLFDIVALWLAVGWTIREFFSVQRAAALLLVPYFLWVSFATALNFSIWRLNQ